MTLLVAGGDQVDAGKTTFSTGLVEHIGAVGFKPRAGNDYWFDHDDVQTATERGRLYGKDARRLAAASPGQFDPEDVNPVHRLWRPSTGPDTGLLGQDSREFVIDRVGSRYVRNGTVELPDLLRERLPLADAVAVESVPELNDAMEQYHLPALEELGETVATTGRAVVESYGDIARPLQSIAPDAVAVVEPLRVRFYDGDRYIRACEVATRSPKAGTLEERVESVVDLLDPAGTAQLPPLTSDDRKRPAAVADAYGHAYEQLLAVADGIEA
ncbi:ATPase [Salinibaculum rarum]|uniref:ATPase n=1 Tax=Salinibaculum rarum TaxID=3058903 RepID=UPI00265EFFF1|nr:ATPase [Salinibaculum sp. KK48]